MAKPVLKWAGGKSRLLLAIMENMPECTGTYYEPFLGGGSVFFGLEPRGAKLNDSNTRLIRTYAAIRDCPDEVVCELSEHARNHAADVLYFYKQRARNIDIESDVEVAAWLMYLNRTAFNGLYRVNQKNRFNVPLGAYKNPTICNEPVIREASRVLQSAALSSLDFVRSCADVTGGDLVYFDPPYVPVSQTSSFVGYGVSQFGPSDHVRLAELAHQLVQRGAHVVISGSWCGETLRVYTEALGRVSITQLAVRRSIAARKEARAMVGEMLLVA